MEVTEEGLSSLVKREAAEDWPPRLSDNSSSPWAEPYSQPSTADESPGILQLIDTLEHLTEDLLRRIPEDREESEENGSSDPLHPGLFSDYDNFTESESKPILESYSETFSRHAETNSAEYFSFRRKLAVVLRKLPPSVLNSPQIYTCSFCDTCFGDKKTLEHHATLHTDNPSFVCTLCGKVCRSSHGVARHRAKSHGADNPTSYPCNLCDKSFTRAKILRQHVKQQHLPPALEKRFPCQACGKTFTTTFHLKRHSFIHSEEKPFKCPLCLHPFTRSDHLQKHYKTRHGHSHRHRNRMNLTFVSVVDEPVLMGSDLVSEDFVLG